MPSVIRSGAIAALTCLLLGSGAAAAATRIVLLPISVHATGTEVEYLQSGLMEMLASRLDQYAGVVVVRPGGDALEARDGDAAREAGRAQGGDYVVFGSFTRFGDGASLDLRCASVAEAGDDESRDETRRVFIQSGTLSEIIPQLDTVAQKVARYTVSGGAQPTLLGEGGAAPVAASPSDYQDLLRRVEALERAAAAEEEAAPGVAAAPGETEAGPDSDS
jgi:TolB-like protein